MKIAITSRGKDLDSKVDPRFGRAAGLIVVDLESGEHRFVENTQNLALAQGAGIQTAMHASDTGASAVITGHVGPKAYQALARGGIDIYFANDATVAEALETFRAGKLEKADGPDKDGHW